MMYDLNFSCGSGRLHAGDKPPFTFELTRSIGVFSEEGDIAMTVAYEDPGGVAAEAVMIDVHARKHNSVMG